MNQESLASELLRELKASVKRWFIAFIIMCVLEVCTIVGFLYYLSLPVEEYSIEQDAITDNGSTSNQVVGGDINGKGISESDIQTQENDNR